MKDSHTAHHGKNGYQTGSDPKYKGLLISDQCDPEQFKTFLKIHQLGETNYFTFCAHSAETEIEKWVVDLNEMTCIYYDKKGTEV